MSESWELTLRNGDKIGGLRGSLEGGEQNVQPGSYFISLEPISGGSEKRPAKWICYSSVDATEGLDLEKHKEGGQYTGSSLASLVEAVCGLAESTS